VRLRLSAARQYCSGHAGNAACAWAAGDNVILNLCSRDDPEDYWEEGEGSLAAIAQVRSEVAAGDRGSCI
jgi:hypothetical protein